DCAPRVSGRRSTDGHRLAAPRRFAAGGFAFRPFNATDRNGFGARAGAHPPPRFHRQSDAIGGRDSSLLSPGGVWISRRIRIEREHCCDDLAVAVFGDPVQYARALTRFEELRLDAQSTLAANGGSLIARIRRLVIAKAESANWSSRWAAGVALITIV